MNKYFYQIEDGQFSFNFEAPLLGNIGDIIHLYDTMTNDSEKLIVDDILTFKIKDIHRYEIMDNNGIAGIVSCCGNINDTIT